MQSSLRVAGRRSHLQRTRLIDRRFPVTCRRHERRTFVDVPTIFLPPVVFGGLVVALWTWKCAMMVIFQNKIIYMPGLPPNARRERIEDYKNQSAGIGWKEERTVSSDGTEISLCVGSVQSGPGPGRTVYILYFQGNASSLPPRLPFLSPVLRSLFSGHHNVPTRYKMVCCSYRGYWTSRGRPSEKGIMMDAAAALDWINKDNKSHHPANSTHQSRVVIWGQSIGAGVATNLAASSSQSPNDPPITTLILETPFLNVRSMLETLYPQKWLPYRYLWPFLRNDLDSYKALGEVDERRRRSTRILLLDAGRDELVPKSQADELQKRAEELGYMIVRRTVGGALHTEAIVKGEGRMAVVEVMGKIWESGTPDDN